VRQMGQQRSAGGGKSRIFKTERKKTIDSHQSEKSAAFQSLSPLYVGKRERKERRYVSRKEGIYQVLGALASRVEQWKTEDHDRPE